MFVLFVVCVLGLRVVCSLLCCFGVLCMVFECVFVVCFCVLLFMLLFYGLVVLVSCFSLNSLSARVLYNLSKASWCFAGPQIGDSCMVSRGLPWSPVVSRGLQWSLFRAFVPPGCNFCLFDLCVCLRASFFFCVVCWCSLFVCLCSLCVVILFVYCC